jgi:hypothetical protein
MPTITIKPINGLTVLDPLTYAPLNANGEEKPRSEYWLRRLVDGDVIEVKTVKQEKTA